MMAFIGEGIITEIKDLKFGTISIKVRDTQVPFTSNNGHKMGERDYDWSLVSRTLQESAHFKKVFFVGARVWFSGKIDQLKTKNTDNNAISWNTVFKIDRIDLYNNSDPKKEGKREKYNKKIVGEEIPNTENNFENDF